MNNRHTKTSLTNIYLTIYLQGSKGLCGVLLWEGAGDRTETAIFLPQTYGRQRCVFLVLLMLNRRPWSPLCWVLAFFTVSYQHHLWTPTHQGFPRDTSAGCGFPYHISSITPPPALTGTRTQLQLGLELAWLLSYIIVQRPLDLWNRMFNRHQAEITVMQFRGHSLPVRQSMRVSWDFFSLSHFVSQFPPTRFPVLTAIGMCHFLPVHHLGMAFLAGSKGQNITH